MNDRYDIVIVGSGHAGAQAAIALRQRQFSGSIAIVGEDRELPYERPPLSKAYLAKEKPFEQLLLRPAAFWQDNSIALRSGQRVVMVDPQAHIVKLDNDTQIGYGKLIWAAGGHARQLSCEGHDLQGVYCVRSRADVDAIMTQLPSIKNVVIVGGGYIGLETAAVLSKLDKKVTVLEAMDRVLARVAGAELSQFFEDEHRAHGVDIRTNARVVSLKGDRRVDAVVLDDGTILQADMVIVGIGIIPSVEPLHEAGAAGTNGVLVDNRCETSLQDVFAVGDCAAHSNTYAYGAVVRLESVQNANDQATVVARRILGEEVVYEALPWFWSNQYDVRLQTIGLSTGHDRTIVRGRPSARSFSVLYLKSDQIIAMDCVNRPKDYVQGRKLILHPLCHSSEELADFDFPLA
ncbi:ferredoxin--NAD(P)(+) reductase fdr [Ochrobactrum quorumnocens]|uniref:Ferredoxin--NAD(P)(+) reductase fdr n=1 Tax=Ochrobactrum quorumnocens TaxID=271865 RepID=A0A248UDI4_9HYPH|nr:FAD-dependent oxidoreductase [[Ochrobactrum] quorumnocens]ASV84883.1 ferredoxin--NAD(P)(+) reductase fdr [[Ochrobactrum] quorumnocens]